LGRSRSSAASTGATPTSGTSHGRRGSPRASVSRSSERPPRLGRLLVTERHAGRRVMVKLALADDTMLGRDVAEHIRSGSPRPLFSDEVIAAVREADLFELNLDCPHGRARPGRGHQVLTAAHLAGPARGEGLAESRIASGRHPGVVRDTRRRLVCTWNPGWVGIPFVRLSRYEPGGRCRPWTALRGSRAPCGCQWAALPSRRAKASAGHIHFRHYPRSRLAHARLVSWPSWCRRLGATRWFRGGGRNRLLVGMPPGNPELSGE
jgi:hypothetical protein